MGGNCARRETGGILSIHKSVLSSGSCNSHSGVDSSRSHSCAHPSSCKSCAQGSAVIADKLLTPADVEKVSGLTGIKLVPRDPSKGAGGDLNFATSDGKLVLMVLVGGASLYQPSKAQKGSFHADVSGIGDEAFDGPSDDSNPFKAPGGTAEPFLLMFRKGTSAITLSTYMNMDAQKLYLSQDKLRELSKTMVSRL